MIAVDLSCDLGEGVGDDAAILPALSSANVACGLHAGDPSVMRKTVEQAARLGVTVGAHPGFADREHFGRLEQPLSPEEIYDLCAYQIGALAAFTRRAGVPLGHVKAHGALYHLAAARAEIADALAAAAREGAATVLVGPPGSAVESAARDRGLRFAAEGFADRGYAPDGRLLPRSHPDALVAGDDALVAARALEMVRTQRIPIPGGSLAVPIHTLCLHGDDPRAAGRAHAIRAALLAAGIRIAPPASWLPG
jgi:UPF0271 protein